MALEEKHLLKVLKAPPIIIFLSAQLIYLTSLVKDHIIHKASLSLETIALSILSLYSISVWIYFTQIISAKSRVLSTLFTIGNLILFSILVGYQINTHETLNIAIIIDNCEHISISTRRYNV